MSGVIVTNPKVQFLGANGAPLVGGTLTTYLAGTTTPTATYQDEALTAANTNPIVLDARGECLLWLDSTKNYKFVLANSSGVVQWTVDDISGAEPADVLRDALAAANGASLIGYTGPAPTSAVTTVDQLAATGTNKGADLVGFLQAGTNAVPTTVQAKLRETVSVFDFMTPAQIAAVQAGTSTDDTAAIQSAIDGHDGIIFFPKGAYAISETIKVKNNSILVGEGSGNYSAGVVNNRITVLKPTSGFTGTEVLRADPADDSAGAVYRYSVAYRGLAIDCINIKNNGIRILEFQSVTNSETTRDVRILNNNNNIGIYIGKSANVSALISDGLVFENIYFLQADYGGSTTNPVVWIGSGNEYSFRDCKFQRGNAPASSAGSQSFLVSCNDAGSQVNAVTIDSCSFTGAETGIRIKGNATDGGGPRHVRVQNCTFEGPLYPVQLEGASARPAQFNVIGPGNRVQGSATMGVTLNAYSNNNQIFVDEAWTIEAKANAAGNLVYGGGTFTNNGSSNAQIKRNGAAVQLSTLYRESTVAPTLLNSWANTNPAVFSSAGYWKSAEGVVHLRGHLTGGTYGGTAGNIIFQLPSGYYTAFSKTISAVTNGGAGSIVVEGGTGNVYAATGSGFISLDGISFFV